MDWHLVVQPLPKDLALNSIRDYRGIHGIAWPLKTPIELVQRMDNQLYSTPNTSSYDFDLSLEYYCVANSNLSKVYFLRCSFDSKENTSPIFAFRGYDYGDPRGGYSCVFDEIICGRHKEFLEWQRRLNRYGLFQDPLTAQEYISFRKTNEIRLKLEENTVCRLINIREYVPNKKE